MKDTTRRNTTTRNVVVSASLPMPAEGISILNDAIERIYGTGEYTLQFLGDSIVIIAPEAGFGPRKTGRGKKLYATEDGLDITSMLAEDEELHITYESASQAVLTLIEAFSVYFTELRGINYISARIQKPGTDGEYDFILQRRAGLSPAEKAAAAADKLDEISALAIGDSELAKAVRAIIERAPAGES